ncbi:MAG: hypothetical protein ACOX9C_01830 [Kiritimatiellia bacterium]
MKKNIAMAVSWCITVGLLVCLWWLWRQFCFQNSELRNLRADLWRQQVSMREKQVAIAERIEGVDENTRGDVIDLLLQSAAEVDVLRDRNDIRHGKDELAELREAIERKRPRQAPAGDSPKAVPDPQRF